MKNIKLKDLLTESEVQSDLRKIEASIKKQVGNDIAPTYEKNKDKRGPRSYEKNHPVLIFNKGQRGKEISVTIGGDYEVEYGWQITGPGGQFHSFKSWDDNGIIKYIVNKLK